MAQTSQRALFWAPRVLAIMFAVFISLFALDVFEAGRSIWEVVQALLVHLIPTYLVLIALAVAWRWQQVGAAIFIALGLLYIVMAWGRFHWSVYAVISGPLLLIGALFLLDWRYRSRRPIGFKTT